MGSTRLFQLRKLKGFPHNLGDNFGRVDSAIPLSYRLEHADHVNALVALVVKAIQAALSRNGDEGSLVEVCICTPVKRFVAPGPSVARQTPAFPVRRPQTSAIKAAPCSWRQGTKRIAESDNANRRSSVSSPGTPKT